MTADELQAEGWHSVMAGQIPAFGHTVEFAREQRVYKQPPWFGKWEEIQPEANVYGLWWRYVVDFA